MEKVVYNPISFITRYLMFIRACGVHYTVLSTRVNSGKYMTVHVFTQQYYRTFTVQHNNCRMKCARHKLVVEPAGCKITNAHFLNEDFTVCFAPVLEIEYDDVKYIKADTPYIYEGHKVAREGEFCVKTAVQ